MARNRSARHDRGQIDKNRLSVRIRPTARDGNNNVGAVESGKFSGRRRWKEAVGRWCQSRLSGFSFGLIAARAFPARKTLHARIIWEPLHVLCNAIRHASCEFTYTQFYSHTKKLQAYSNGGKKHGIFFIFPIIKKLLGQVSFFMCLQFFWSINKLQWHEPDMKLNFWPCSNYYHIAKLITSLPPQRYEIGFGRGARPEKSPSAHLFHFLIKRSWWKAEKFPISFYLCRQIERITSRRSILKSAETQPAPAPAACSSPIMPLIISRRVHTERFLIVIFLIFSRREKSRRGKYTDEIEWRGKLYMRSIILDSSKSYLRIISNFIVCSELLTFLLYPIIISGCWRFF